MKLTDIIDTLKKSAYNACSELEHFNPEVGKNLNAAVAALPEPMTEEEISQLIWDKADKDFTPESIVRAIRDAGVLLVREK